MTSEKWQKVKDLFDAALKLASSERRDFLDENCGSDDELRREVENLLASFGGSENAPKESDKESVSTKENLENGRVIAHYEIISQIGAGGMGEVYMARDARLNRKVALKILHKNIAADQDRLSRFQREAWAVSSLNHPNILTIFEFAEESGLHFLASEYVAGKTLRELLNERNLTILETLDIAAQIASALKAAHDAGVIHRDIKPENVMIRDDGYVKVLDFGLAKLIEPRNEKDEILIQPASDHPQSAIRNPQSTVPGMVMGTASYMSPEQARGLFIDARTDIFSFGAVLFEMITRRQLFTGETINHIIVSVLEKETPALSHFVKDYPFELERIVKKCLMKKADERYRTVEELLTDLKRLHKKLEYETEQNYVFESENQTRSASQTLFIEPDKTLAFGDEFSEKQTESVPPNNLSVNFQPIIGREKEIAEIKNLLRRSNVQLLTLTGIGGTGKTTISQAVAREMLAEFSDGVYFIELASITNPELVASTVAQPLGVKESGGRPMLEILKEYLNDKKILLVIDNFEQIADAARIVAELLSAAENLKILITSRVLLHLSAENEYAVPPLAAPPDAESFSTEDLMKFEAVRLFAERGRGAKSSFALTNENKESVAKICSRLEGLPLAIELAAARVKILSPPQILSKLENRLQLLTGGAKDLPARQQTMRGAVAWSYDLLSDNEKKLFEIFSVFVGGFTFEAAEAVGAGSGSPESENPAEDTAKTAHSAHEFPLGDILDGITSLVDKSLLISKERDDGEMRFRMLEVVREFALEMLEARGAAEIFRRSHAAYFLALGEEAQKFLKTEDSVRWLNRLEDEHDNLRAALRWSLKSDVKIAARLAASIRLFWFLHSYLAEGRDWLRAVLERVRGDKTVKARFSLMNVLGTLERFQGNYPAAEKTYRELLAEAGEADDLWHVAEANSGLGSVAYQQGDFAGARKFIEESLSVSRKINEKHGIAAALNSLGDIARTEGARAEARELFEEALTISKNLGTKQFVCAILANLGAINFEEGDLDAARERFKEALETADELGNRTIISLSLDGFAAIAAERGEAECAARLSGAADRMRESIGYEIEPADSRFRDSFLKKLRSSMSETDLSASFERGRTMKAEEAVAQCLENNWFL